MKTRNPSILLHHLWPLAAFLLATSTPSAVATEALLTDDSTIYTGSAAATWGPYATTRIDSVTTKCAVLRFEITSMLPAGVTADNIATATLRLFPTTVTGTGTVSVYKVLPSKSWTEADATGVWVVGTDYDSTAILSAIPVSSFSTDDYTALDVTSTVKGWITTPSDNNGFILRPGGTIAVYCEAKETTVGGHNAVLDITLKGDVGEVVGLYNSTYGVDALHSNTTGAYNVALGHWALYYGTTGTRNVATGIQALYTNTTGDDNVATGFQSLLRNTTGSDNVALGQSAMAYNTTGTLNVAVGESALYSNTDGYHNAAVGFGALLLGQHGVGNTAVGTLAMQINSAGNHNTALGYYALGGSVSSGSHNICLGYMAGYSLTTGSSNIDLGNPGVAGESNTIRIGATGTHTATYIAGISGATAASGVAVYIDANGHLGTLTSSARFKRNIADMDISSEAILALRPVSFRYKDEIDSQNIPQYGLTAEEVAEIAADLVARDANGDIYTVRYEAVNAMLLNEFQKEHKRVEAQENKLSAQERAIARQQEQIQKLTESMAELGRRVPSPTDKN